MTMIGRVIDGLPLAASMQSDQDVCMPCVYVTKRSITFSLCTVSFFFQTLCFSYRSVVAVKYLWVFRAFSTMHGFQRVSIV